MPPSRITLGDSFDRQSISVAIESRRKQCCDSASGKARDSGRVVVSGGFYPCRDIRIILRAKGRSLLVVLVRLYPRIDGIHVRCGVERTSVTELENRAVHTLNNSSTLLFGR